MVVDKIKSDKTLDAELEETLNQAGYDVNRLANGKKLVLVTGHRRENFGDGFISMCKAIKTLTEKYPDVDFVYPMHLNPNVRKPIHEVFGEDLSNLGNMFFIEPLEYLSFVYLMEKSTIVLTHMAALVMRDTTVVLLLIPSKRRKEPIPIRMAHVRDDAVHSTHSTQTADNCFRLAEGPRGADPWPRKTSTSP